MSLKYLTISAFVLSVVFNVCATQQASAGCGLSQGYAIGSILECTLQGQHGIAGDSNWEERECFGGIPKAVDSPQSQFLNRVQVYPIYGIGTPLELRQNLTRAGPQGA